MSVSASQYQQASTVLSHETYRANVKALMEKHGVKSAQADIDSWMLIKADGRCMSNEEIAAFSAEITKLTNESGLFEFKLNEKAGYWRGVQLIQDSPEVKKYYFTKTKLSEDDEKFKLLKKQDWSFNTNDERDFLHDILPERGFEEAKHHIEGIMASVNQEPEKMLKVIKLRKTLRMLAKHGLTPGRDQHGIKTFFTWNGGISTKEQVDAFRADVESSEFDADELNDLVEYLRSRYREVRARLGIAVNKLDQREDGRALNANEMVELTKARIELHTAEDMVGILPLLLTSADGTPSDRLDMVDAFCRRHNLRNTGRVLGYRGAIYDAAANVANRDASASSVFVDWSHRFAGGDNKGHLEHTPLPE